jgi:cytoskeletal protein CcmA (bactofilin family)
MFSKNRQAKPMKKEIPGQPNINMISHGSVITGTFQSKSDLRVSGTIDGHVHAESKCIVSESGLVKGDLTTKEADIAGTVDGELTVINRLILRSTAKVAGDITTKILMVEEGAKIDGACKMADNVDLSKGSKNSNGVDTRKTESVSS